MPIMSQSNLKKGKKERNEPGMEDDQLRNTVLLKNENTRMHK